MDDASAAGHADPPQARGRLLCTLDVEGEVFEVRTHDGGTDYDWVSGPNKDYGFTTSARDMPQDWHRESIRDFLHMVDPVTGYLEDD